MRVVALIARREIVSRLQQKGFRIGLGIALVLIVLACLAPKVIGGSGGTSYDVGVAGTHAGTVTSTLQRIAGTEQITVHVHPASPEQAREKVRKGSWDVAIVDDAQILAKKPDTRAVALVQAAHQSLATLARLQAAGLSAAQVDEAFDIPPLPVAATGSADDGQRQVIASITVAFLFAQLIAFCTWVAMGVVEEKASRVVELVLSAVRPLQLLTGKLVGIGLLAIGQVLLLAAGALVASTAAGTLHVPGVAYATAAISFGWFVLGFAFFSALAAGLASLVSRQEEVSGVLSPVTALLMVSYVGSFAVAAVPDSAAARVLSIVPPISAIAMPARIARGGVPVLDVVLAVALMVVVTVAIVGLAARVYRAAVLHTGSRLTLRRAWRAEAVGDLA